MGFACKPAIEDTLNRVLVNFKHVGEFEQKCAAFVLFETEAAGKGVEARDGESLVVLSEDDVLKFKDFSNFFLDFHEIIKTMVSDPFLFLRYGGGLRHGSCEDKIVKNTWKGSEVCIIRFEGTGRGSKNVHFL